MKVSCGGGINFTWYLCYYLEPNGKVWIYIWDRLHNERDKNHPEVTNGKCSIIYDSETGNIVKVKIEDKIYEVENPQNRYEQF